MCDTIHQTSTMGEDAWKKVLATLPVLKRLIMQCEIPLNSGLLPWYDRKAWKFGVEGNLRHIVVVVGGRSDDPADDAYLSHISWRKDDEGTFRCFQANIVKDAKFHNMLIRDWFKIVQPDIDDELDYVITKEPERVTFECRACGCEFSLPAKQCKRKITHGCGWKHGGSTHVWNSALCPYCGAACSKEYVPSAK